MSTLYYMLCPSCKQAVQFGRNGGLQAWRWDDLMAFLEKHRDHDLRYASEHDLDLMGDIETDEFDEKESQP